MVKSAVIREDKNGRSYLDMVLSDSTGDIAAKKWDIHGDGEEAVEYYSSLKTGDMIHAKGLVSEWKGINQYTLKIIYKADEKEFDIREFVKTAPEPARDMFDFIWDRTESMADPQLKALCKRLLEDNREKLMYYPAASKNHHSIMSGLLYHMKRMLMTGDRICQVYDILDRDLVAAGVIVHDMEKIKEIKSNEYGISDGYSFEGMMLGHIVQGVRNTDAIMEELGFSHEKRVMIQHMILSHHYEPEYGSPKKPMFPEAEILHHLDMIDARMYDMEDALSKTDAGQFSESVWSLDNRRVYKKK